MKKLLVLAVLLMLTFAIGCRPGTGVINLQNIAVTTTNQEAVKAEDVRKAILAGCVASGWTAHEVSPGHMEAKTTVRGKHYVVVDIPYTASTYSIKYKFSSHMEYNEAKNTIHPNYNSWVNTLRRNIDAQIATINTK